MPPIELAAYDPRREAELVSLWRDSFEFGVGVVDPHSIDEQAAYFRTEVLPKCDVRVATDGATLVGFIAATPSRIDQLYVRVRTHRQGIGSRLLGWAKTQSSGSLQLYTFARNRVARAFYERHGFVIETFGFEPAWKLDDVLYRWTREAQREAPAGVTLTGS